MTRKETMLIKCRNWEIEITNLWTDGHMHGWLEYVGATIPNFGSCMSFAVDNKDGKLVISADNPEYLPEYLKKKIRTEYIKMTKSRK